MNHRYYVIIGLDVEGHLTENPCASCGEGRASGRHEVHGLPDDHAFKEAAPAHGTNPFELEAAARFVQALLRDALAARDIGAAVTDAIALSPQAVDLIVLAVRDDATKREAAGLLQKERLDKKLAELRVAVDGLLAEPKSTP